MRLGIFGGTFDPVHYGHLLLAECCREQLGLETVWFLPAAVPPHKQQRELTGGAQRIEMLELAIAGHTAFSVSRYEIERGGVNYTVDTLAHFAAESPARELVFLMGADSLADFPTWKDPVQLCQIATPAVVLRAPVERSAPERDAAMSLDWSGLQSLVSAERLAVVQAHQVEMPRVDLSSSDIRRRAAQGHSIRYRTPRAVEKYIETHGLYRATR
jgi:nicotinate-nucleotide adenylyltransferase